MNPASRIWDIPPPPGTEDDIPLIKKDLKPEKEVPVTKECQKSVEKDTTLERPIDRINPYLKNPEYVEYEKRRHERRHRSRSRSYSRERYHRRKYSRSRSRDRYHSSKAKSRRSRSRSRHRRRRYTSSRSRSRSPSYRRHKYRKRSYSRSKSRSKSASRSRHVSRKRSEKDKKSRSQSRSPKIKQEPAPDVDTNEVDMKIEEEEDDPMKDNVFKNDGTFLEMFKKMQEQQQKVVETPAPVESKKVLPVFGKRRGGKVLKTGMVKKPKLPNEEEGSSEDAWSVYMKEVRRYKEACCDDDSKTRPLVK